MAERPQILSAFKDKRILVVEDEYFLADEVRQKLTGLGAVVVGPVATVTDAMDLIDCSDIDAAILDVHLGDEFVFPVADRLDELDIPFVFATGYDPAFIPVAYGGFALCEKPTELAKIAQALWGGAYSQLN